MKYFIACVLLVFVFSATAQKRDTDLGDTYFDYFQYDDAIQSYQAALSKTPEGKKAYLYRQIGRCYQYSFRYLMSEQWFDKLLHSGEPPEEDDYLEYGIALKANGKYDEAKSAFETYHKITTGNAASRLQTSSINWAIRNRNATKPVSITLTNLDISGQALGLSPFGEGLLYVHARNKKPNGVAPVFDLDYAEQTDSIHFVYSDGQVPGIAFEANEGAPCVSRDGHLLFFMANASKVKSNGKAGGIEVSEEGVSNFRIYVAENRNGTFTNVRDLPCNGKDFNSIHPYISDDGNALYFASDRPGGFGGLDLYVMRRDASGNWTKPINLGGTVNTMYNETYPVIQRGRLYFSSKGLIGYGGYDIYTALMGADDKPGIPQNMGLPINSFRDDHAFLPFEDGRYGYFGSNRNDSNGNDRVYFFHDHTLDPMANPAIVALNNKKPEPVNEPVLANIRFSYNTATSIGAYQATLDSAATLAQHNPSYRFRIKGHADARGTEEHNMDLSRKRALMVRDELTRRGVQLPRIIVEAFGESKPLNHCKDGVNCTEEEFSINSRVEITLVK